MESANILIVDDNPTFCKLTGDVLQFNGFSVLTAGDGETALGILESKSVDLLLLDLRLPDIGGIDVHAKLNQDLLWGV